MCVVVLQPSTALLQTARTPSYSLPRHELKRVVLSLPPLSPPSKHYIHNGLQKLEELVHNINDIIENRVEKNLKMVSANLSFVSVDLLYTLPYSILHCRSPYPTLPYTAVPYTLLSLPYSTSPYPNLLSLPCIVCGARAV